MERFKVNINKSKLSVACLALALGLTGCNSNKVRNDLPDTTESTTTATTEIATEENNLVSEELNINDNVSIENVLDENYSKYIDFYESEGISKDALRDVIFVLNDKYTDEDGYLLLDEESAKEAYGNIKTMLVSDEIYRKINNIYQLKNYPEIIDEEDNNWKIATHPSFVPLLDKNVAGANTTIKKIKEFEELRDSEVELMNSTNTYDVDIINNYVIDMETHDYDSNDAAISKVKNHGQKYLLAASNFKALDLASNVNPEVTYLPGYDSIEKYIKINPTQEEMDLINELHYMTDKEIVDGSNLTAAINYVDGLTYTPEEELLLEKFGLTNAELKLVMSYANYISTMAYPKYVDIMCFEEKATRVKIEESVKYIGSMSKQYKKEQ